MIRLSIRRPVAVTMAYATVALLGVAAWRNIPIELLPDVQLPQLSVGAEWRGASPEALEALVTSPLEAAVQQVRGVQKVSSTSMEQQGSGVATISVEFARGTDMDFARLELSERLGAVEQDLPPGVRPTVTPYVPREFEDQNRPFLQYTLTGPYTLEALRAHVDDFIQPEVTQLQGVAHLAAYGGRQRVIEIELDEGKALALGLEPMRVMQRIAELEYVQQAAGMVRSAGLLRTVAIRHQTQSAAELRDVPILTYLGNVIRVRDVADVYDTLEEPSSYYRIDGRPAVSFYLYRDIGTNTVAVADRVKAHLEAIEHLHPSGIELILDRDESEAVRTQLTDLRYRALVAAIVIFFVLLIFLRSVRSAAIIFATIGFSVLITLNLIYFGGLTLNVLTLMGIAMGFGLIVDYAIVVLENIYRRRRQGEAATVAAERGAREVVLPIIAAMATTVVVFFPFIYLQGDLRVYYVPFAIAVGFSLIASIFVAFTFIPALAARVLGHGFGPVASGAADEVAGDPTHSVMVSFGERPPFYIRLYAWVIGYTVRWPWGPLITVVLAAACLGGSYYAFNKYVTRGTLWTGFWADRTYIDVQINLPRGEELARTDELTRYFEERIASMPEVDRFVTNVRPLNGNIRVTFPDSLNLTAIPVIIKEQLVAYSHLFGGVQVRVYGYGPSFYGGGGGAPNYRIQIKGYNYETVRQIAEDLGARFEAFSRINEVDTNASGRGWTRDRATEITLELDRERLGFHDLTARQVVGHVQAATRRAGGTSARIRIGGEEVGYAVTLSGNQDMDVLALGELLIPNSTGADVRLNEVATLDERNVLSQILREDQQYERTLAYEFRGPVRLGDHVRDAILDATELPAGYSITRRQAWQWSDEERRQIWTVLVIAIVLIFMVTAALFESVRQPLVVLTAVPMALVGVFLIFWKTNASFTREAYIGTIIMGGIVVNNAILLVHHVNRLRREGGLPLQIGVVRGTLERVRPILMTSTTTIFGLLPLVLFSETVNSNIWNALALALVGGLASSTILVLTVTPALYTMCERGPEKRRLAREAREAALEQAAATAPGTGD